MLARKAKTLVRLTPKTLSLSEDVAPPKPIELSKLEEPYGLTWEQMSRLYSNARRSYVLRSIDSRGVLFLAEDNSDFPAFYRSRGWAKLFSRGLNIISVSGNHEAMIQHQSNRQLLARKMDEALNRIQASGQ